MQRSPGEGSLPRARCVVLPGVEGRARRAVRIGQAVRDYVDDAEVAEVVILRSVVGEGEVNVINTFSLHSISYPILR